MTQPDTQTEGFNPFQRLGCSSAEGGLVLLSFLTRIIVLPIILTHEGFCNQTTLCNNTYDPGVVGSTPQATKNGWHQGLCHIITLLIPGAVMLNRLLNKSITVLAMFMLYVLVMPHSKAGPLLHVCNFDSHSQGLMALSVHPGLGKRWNAANFSISLNLSLLPSPIASTNCSSSRNISHGLRWYEKCQVQ